MYDRDGKSQLQQHGQLSKLVTRKHRINGKECVWGVMVKLMHFMDILRLIDGLVIFSIQNRHIISDAL